MLQICDIHSHLLPGIDDGADSWDDTMEMIRMAYKSGVREIIATPHFLPWEKRHNTGRVEELCREAMLRAGRDLNVRIGIHPGQELFYHQDLLHELDSSEALTLAGTRYVLVEFDEEAGFDKIRRAVITLTRGGYRPVIAHFERFSCLRTEGRVDEIRSLGARIQSNIREPGLHGRFSADYRWLRHQYKNGNIDFTGSDMHNTSSRPPVSRQDVRWYVKNLPADYCENLLWGNGMELLGSGR